jgi:integrase
MRKIYFQPIYNRKKKLNAQGKALLQVEAYLEKRKIYFSTHIYLSPEQWDNKRKLICKHPHAEALNYQVKEFLIQLESKELSLWKEGKVITLDRLKEEFSIKKDKSFLDFVIKNIENSLSKESTKQNLLSTYTLLAKFKSHIDFKELTPEFIFDFESFLFSSELQTNTVAKHMKHFKTFVNLAIDKGYLTLNDYPFRRYRIKTLKSKHTFLLPDELEKLESLELTGKSVTYRHSLEAFLFCCYTGLRYSDFTQLSEKNIVFIEKLPWIIFTTIKTGAEVRLPLALLFGGKGWKLLRKHQKHLNEFFNLKANSTVNKDLIRIGKLAGIQKHFSFHSARHTNATLLIYKGVNITTVQKLLGHRNVATTQIYSEVMGSTIVNDLKKCSKGNR